MTYAFPAVIDNTIRKAFATCETKTMYAHVMNLRPIDEHVVDLHFGRCFASGVEWVRIGFFQRGYLAEEAIETGIDLALIEYGAFIPPAKSNKTKAALERSLRYYFEVWPLGEDGLTPVEDGIECRFAYDLPILHPDTGEFLKYAGRYDMQAIDARGRIHLVDEKTTSKFSDAWIDQWELDTQITGYIWAAHQGIDRHKYGEDVEIVGQIRGVSILKGDNGHVELPITRSEWIVERWYDELLWEIEDMIDRYKKGKWKLALHGNACVSYNRKCDYHALCCTPNPEQRIEGNYKEVVWNPLAK